VRVRNELIGMDEIWMFAKHLVFLLDVTKIASK